MIVSIGFIIALIIFYATNNIYLAAIVGVIVGPIAEVLLNPFLSLIYVRFGLFSPKFLWLGSNNADYDTSKGMRVLVMTPKGDSPRSLEWYKNAYTEAIRKELIENEHFRALYSEVMRKELLIEAYRVSISLKELSVSRCRIAFSKMLKKRSFICADGKKKVAVNEYENALVGFMFDNTVITENAQEAEPVVDASFITLPIQAKPAKKMAKRTIITVTGVAVVLAITLTVLIVMAVNYIGPFSNYREPFILARADGLPFSQSDIHVIEQIMAQRFEERHERNPRRLFRLTSNENGAILLSINGPPTGGSYSRHLSDGDDYIYAFFTRGLLEIKTESGETILYNGDFESINRLRQGDPLRFYLNASGKSKLSSVLSETDPVVLHVYYDGMLINTQTLHFPDESNKNAPNLIQISPLSPNAIISMMQYTVMAPLPVDVTLEGFEPLDISVYIASEDSWEVAQKGSLSRPNSD